MARGLTLIEVVAAIAILGTILVGVVLSSARLTHQAALARRQAVAVRAADELITRWWTAKEGVPVGAEGAVESDPTLLWTVQLVENEPVARLGARVVRVTICEADPKTSAMAAAEEELVNVDLVMPVPKKSGSLLSVLAGGADHE
jgi:prepilin-type N-terminal cleavage/methylation domain-containing protein